MNYPTRLRALNLPSLVYRRKKNDTLQVTMENFGESDLGGPTRGKATNYLKQSEDKRKEKYIMF